MASKQAFWSVPAKDGEPDLWVCMSCLSEALCRTYEAFTLAAVQDWGTEELIAKAVAAQRDAEAISAATNVTPPLESVP